MQPQQEPSTVADDPQARDLLRRAFEATARWPKDFQGFTADLTVNVNGKETSGSVLSRALVKYPSSSATARPKSGPRNNFGMIAVHRGPRSFEESDGKYSLTMEEDGHPFGTKLNIHGSNSFYRVKDNRITQINRKMAHPGMNPLRSRSTWKKAPHARPEKSHDQVHRLLLFTHRWETHQCREFHGYSRPSRCLRSPGYQTDHHVYG